MRQIKVLSFLAAVCIFCFALPAANAQGDGSDRKSELASDKQEIKTEKQEIGEHASEARAEEKQLRSEMAQAESSGDTARAAQIREQLKAMHAENIQQMRQDKQELKEAKQELRQDVKGARQDMRMNRRPDKDDNPPGPRGGRGTNWENPPGPQGGIGASPNMPHVGNPPGPAGGPGTGNNNLQEKAIVDQRWEKNADTNKDGVVDKVEMNQWKTRRQNPGNNQQGSQGEQGTGSNENIQEKAVVDQEWEKKADTNKDGVVDKVEINQWKTRRRQIR